jgi:hypothetical protein
MAETSGDLPPAGPRRASAWGSTTVEAVVHFKSAHQPKGKPAFKASPDRTGVGSLQGMLTKQAQNVGKAQDRWCVLSNEFLVYYESEEACLNPSAQPKGLLNLKRVESVEVDGLGSFTLSFDKPSGVAPRVFTAGSEKEAARWAKNIARRLEWLSLQATGGASASGIGVGSGGGVGGGGGGGGGGDGGSGGTPSVKGNATGVPLLLSHSGAKVRARDRLTFRCFELEHGPVSAGPGGRRAKLLMRELVIDRFGVPGTFPKLTIMRTTGAGIAAAAAAAAPDSKLLASPGNAGSSGISNNAAAHATAHGGSRRATPQTTLASLELITHVVRCNVSTDARMFYYSDEGFRTTTAADYRFPDAATRDNFCFSLHLLCRQIRVLEEGEVPVGPQQLAFQVKYIFRNMLSRTGMATLDLERGTMTLAGYHFIKSKTVIVRVTGTVQILAHPTKPLHLLLGCEGGFSISVVDAAESSSSNISSISSISSIRGMSSTGSTGSTGSSGSSGSSSGGKVSTDGSLSEFDIKFPSVALRERFAGRLRAMGYGLAPPCVRRPRLRWWSRRPCWWWWWRRRRRRWWSWW